MARSSAYREQLMKKGREAGRSLMKREKYRGKNGSLRNTSTDSKGTTFVILINHTSTPIRKGKIETNEQSKEEGQPK